MLDVNEVSFYHSVSSQFYHLNIPPGENSFVSPFPKSIGLLTKLTHLNLGKSMHELIMPMCVIISCFIPLIQLLVVVSFPSYK